MHLNHLLKSITLTCCFITGAILPALAQKIIPTDTSSYRTIRIDPPNARGGNVSDIFEQVSYIPLETTPESLFGSISQLEVTDDYYIILDKNTSCILIFTKAGKFHAKIKCKRISAGRTVGPFYFNRWTKQIAYSDDRNRNMTYCDLDGKLVKTEKWAYGWFYPTRFNYIAPDKLVDADMYRDEDEKSPDYRPYFRSLLKYVVLAKAKTENKDDKTVYATGFSYTPAQGKKQTSHAGVGPLSYFGNDTTLFYSEYFNYRVDVVTPTAIKRAYQFILPLALALPKDFATDTAYDTDWDGFFNSHRDYVYSINNFYKTGNNLLFAASNHNYDTKEHQLVYNLQSGNLIALQHIMPDDMSHMLPLFGNNFDSKGLLACDGQYTYADIASLTLFKAYEANKDKNAKYTPALIQYFKGTKKDNPVIVQLKIKGKL